MLREHEQGKKVHEKFMKSKIPVRVTLILEGFQSEQEEFSVSSSMRIRKAPLTDRQEFYSRASNLLNSSSLPR